MCRALGCPQTSRALPGRAGEDTPPDEVFYLYWLTKVTPLSIETFAPPYSEAAVEDLRLRLARTRWPDEISGSGWTYGVDLNFMQRLCEYWRDEFDWKAHSFTTTGAPSMASAFTSFTNPAGGRSPFRWS